MTDHTGSAADDLATASVPHLATELPGPKAREWIARDAAEALEQACFRAGRLVLTCGPAAVGLAPPLVVTAEQADLAVDLVAGALADSRPPFPRQWRAHTARSCLRFAGSVVPEAMARAYRALLPRVGAGQGGD